MSTLVIRTKPTPVPTLPHRRSLTDLLAPLDAIASGSPNLIANHGARFTAEEREYRLPRYLFIGPKGGDDPVRLGIFAGIHGDEPEGVHASIRFLKLLETHPELATGYCLFVYPVCNPTGFEDNTRLSRSGRDLNREFWRQSTEPEVRLLESEMVSHCFHGIISLHTDDTSTGFYGFAHGATLTHHLLDPALEAAGRVLPRNQDPIIDGFRAQNGVIREAYEGILSAPPRVRPRPFEIILETPKAPAEFLKESAFVLALNSILTGYRPLIAYAANL